MVEDPQEVLSEMKVKELRAFAKRNDIDLRGLKTKKDIISAIVAHEDIESLLGLDEDSESIELPTLTEEELALPSLEEELAEPEKPEEPAFDEEDIREALSGFTVAELRKMAEKYNIGTTGCKKKDDYLDVLSKRENFQLIMQEVDLQEREEDLERIKDELIDVAVDIEETIEEVEALPSMRDDEADKMLIEARNIDVDFNDVEDLLDYARMRYEEENFDKAVDLSREAIVKARRKSEDFMKLALAYQIMSNERLLERMKRSGKDLSEPVSILVRSKEAYKDGHLEEDIDLMNELSVAITALYSEDIRKIKDSLYEVGEFVSEISNLGADVTVARDLLQRGRDAARRSDNMEASRLMGRAKEVALKAKEKRIDEIKEMIPKAHNLIDEAKHLGADVGEAEKMLMQAQIALDNDDYILCAELAGRAQAKTNEVQHYQIQKAMDIRERQIHKAKRRMERLGGLIAEADMYNLTVAKPKRLLYVAKETIREEDFVRMTRYVASTQNAVDKLMPRILNERKKRGIEKPKSGVCGSCKSKDLKFSDDGFGICNDCGKIFTWIVPPEKSFLQKLRSFLWE